MRRILIHISLFYFLIYGLIAIALVGLDLYFSSLLISNLYEISFFLFIPILFLWLFEIKHDGIRKWGMGIYSSLIILLSPLLLLIFAWLLNDLRLGNGFRTVYEYNLEEEKHFVIYRSPDEGGLGGDHIAMAVVTPVAGIFEHRDWVSPDFQEDSTTGSTFIQIENTNVPIPSMEEIYSKGNLNK